MLIQPGQQYNPGRNSSWLTTLIDPQVTNWLDDKTKSFLLDYLMIREGYKSWGVVGLTDYSYLITPAYKALEGTLLQIAESLNFDVNKYNFRIGVIFSEESLEKFYNDVLEKISDLAKEEKIDVEQWLNNARRLLRHLRHSPAHYNGELKDSWNKAFLLGDQILFTINEMCLSLLNSKVFDKIAELNTK